MVVSQKGYQVKGIQYIFHKLKTGCQFHLTSAFPWCCFRCPWEVCPVTACVVSCKRTRFPFRCPCTCTPYNCFCLVFSNKFNTISAFFIHQPPTLPQKIDSREGLFWCKKGLVCVCDKMNLYLKAPPPAPDLGLFAAKYKVKWCKTQCVLLLNAVRFDAKRNVKWC